MTSAVPAEAETDSILAAEVVVVGGRGAEEPESFALLKAFADKIGAAIGGTRPLGGYRTDPVPESDRTDRIYDPSEDLHFAGSIRSNPAYRRNQRYETYGCHQYR